MSKAARTAMFVWGCTVAAGASSDPVVQAFRFFEAVGGGDTEGILRALRPPEVSPGRRSRAIASLPETGELRPDRDERAKLAMLKDVLSFHERTDVFATIVVDVPQAAVALHDRTVLLISRPALRLVSGSELQAVVAHEIGHDYFWRDFEDMLASGDKSARQELELKCDGIAVLTLIVLKFDPAALTDALRKFTNFNAAIGATANVDGYPTLPQRQRFIRELRQRYGASQPTNRASR